MKKLIAMILALAAVFSLTACDSNTENPEETQVQDATGGAGMMVIPEDTEPTTPEQTRPQVSYPTQPTSLVVDMNDYLKVSFGGFEGKGYAWCRYDDFHLMADVYPFIAEMYTEGTVGRTLDGDDNHEIPVFTPVYDGERLSTGDVIRVYWEVNERGLMLLKQQLPNVEFVYEDTEVTVEGLESILTFDPFNCDWGDAHLDAEAEGSDVSGQAILSDWAFFIRMRGHGNSFFGVKVTVDELGHQGYWSNGDQVKVTIHETDEYLLEEYGVILTTKTGYVTIDWLTEPETKQP